MSGKGGLGLPNPPVATVQPGWIQSNTVPYDDDVPYDESPVTDSVGSGDSPPAQPMPMDMGPSMVAPPMGMMPMPPLMGMMPMPPPPEMMGGPPPVMMPPPPMGLPMMPMPMMPMMPMPPDRMQHKYKIIELTCCQKCYNGGCITPGNIERAIEQVNPGILASGSKVQHGGVILMAHGTVAIFPEDMEEMEDCFYAGVGVVHVLFSLLFLALGVCGLVVNTKLRFAGAGIWAGVAVGIAAIFSFITAKKELRTNAKKLTICVSIALAASVAFTVLSYISASSDGIYNDWEDIEGDQPFKFRAAVDGIGIVAGVLEAAACCAHLSSLFSNLNPELTYRCCSRRKFRRFLKELTATQQAGEERHLQKKKEMMQMLIKDLEEEERYKEKWQRVQKKLMSKQAKEMSSWGVEAV